MRSLKVTEANRAWGRNYSREFRAWIKRHGFDKMPAATRSVAVELHEHAEAIRGAMVARATKATAHSPAIGHKTLASLSAHGKCPHRTYGATPSKRGLVSVPARRHCRRLRPRRSGDS